MVASLTPEFLNMVVFTTPSLLNVTPDGESSPPLAIALTEWHFIVLARDRLTAYSRLTESLVWQARVPLVR